MATVWILEKGEHHEGGTVLGVFATKNLAFEQFVREAEYIHRSFSLSDLSEGSEGQVYASGGCDWLCLSEYTVTDTPQLPA